MAKLGKIGCMGAASATAIAAATAALSGAAGAGAAEAAETITYEYDARGRLTEVERSGGTTTAYSFDKADNRLSMTVTGATAPPPPPPPPSGPVALEEHVAANVTDLGGQTYKLVATAPGGAAVSSTAVSGNFLLSVLRTYKNGDTIHFGLSTDADAQSNSSGMAVRVHSIGVTNFVYINGVHHGTLYAYGENDQLFIRRTDGVIRFYIGTDAATAVHATSIADYTDHSAFFFDSAFEEAGWADTHGLQVRFEGAPPPPGPVAIVEHSNATVSDLGGQTYKVVAQLPGAAAVSSAALSGNFLLSVLRTYKNGDTIHFGLSTDADEQSDSSGMTVRVHSIGVTNFVYINGAYHSTLYAYGENDQLFIRRTGGVIRFYIGTDAATAVHATSIADYTDQSAFFFDSSFEEAGWANTQGLQVRFESQ